MFGNYAQVTASLSALESAVATSPSTKADISQHIARVFVIGPPMELIWVPSIQMGAGVQLTTDGYVVVDYSVVGRMFGEWKERADRLLSQSPTKAKWAKACKESKCTISIGSKDYPLDIGFLGIDGSTNMALIKAYMPGVDPAPSGIGFSARIPRKGDSVTLLGLRGNVQESATGKVGSTRGGSFLTDIPTAYNFSKPDYLNKGAFVKRNGELVGVPLIFQLTKEQVANGISAPLVQKSLQKIVGELRRSYESRIATGVTT